MFLHRGFEAKGSFEKANTRSHKLIFEIETNLRQLIIGSQWHSIELSNFEFNVS